MNTATLKAMKGIEVVPGPTTKDVSTVSIHFKPGNFDLAVAFGRWLEEQTGKKATVMRDEGGRVVADKAR